jgi:hypothetical protein
MVAVVALRPASGRNGARGCRPRPDALAGAVALLLVGRMLVDLVRRSRRHRASSHAFMTGL